MGDVVPSHYHSLSSVGDLDHYDGGAFSNDLMRVGEVKRVVYPEDPDSRSKRFLEYDVYVQHRENGTAVSKLYHNVVHANALCGLADRLVATLRADPKAGVTRNSQQSVVDGVGSKVLILCPNAEHASAVILSGLRDTRDSDLGVKARGHFLEWEFNGVRLAIEKDGSFRVTMLGPTTAEGIPQGSTGGSYIEVKADGTLRAATPEDAQSITIDHRAGTITVDAQTRLTLTADRIDHGAGADQHAVLGDTLVEILGDWLQQNATETHICVTGEGSPPVNAPQYLALRARLRSALSEFVFVKKTKH